MTDSPSRFPDYKRVRLWCQEYGRKDVPDDRAATNFMECETAEEVRSLQAELIGLSSGNFDEKILDHVVGVHRKAKYGSYVEWAKLMLRWIASYKG